MLTICHLSVVPIRKEPSDKSEQVTQLLFGELAEISEINGNWAKVSTLEEGYTGYVDPCQLTEISDEDALVIQATWNQVVSSQTAEIHFSSGKTMHLVCGSRIPESSSSGLTLFPHFEFKGNKVLPGQPVPDTIKSIAFDYLGAPYQWGGKSPFGIDCSGFTQMVFRINGIALPRDAWQQAETGVLLEKNDEVRTGDLAFFKNSDGKIVHVGIVLQQGQIIHASGEVRVDSLDQEGIFNNSTGKYSHRLDSLRRYF